MLSLRSAVGLITASIRGAYDDLGHPIGGPFLLKLQNAQGDTLMNIFHGYAIGLALGAAVLLVASASEAKVPVAPLKGAATITKVAEGCGPGGWRGPGGACHYGGRRCWRGPYGGLHCA